MEASRLTISGKTFDLGHLSGKKKTNLRRKVIIEYIQSKPAGEIIRIGDFQRVGRFSTPANTDAFLKRMLRDGVICRYKGEKLQTYYYSVTGAMRVSTPKKVLEQLPEPTPAPVETNSPDINSFVAEMQRLGVEFTITITNKKES